MTNTTCPCGSQIDYQHCCYPFHAGISFAPNAECLMRSRYSAFVNNQCAYLIDTHHPDYLNGLTAEMLSDNTVKWLGLQIENADLKSDTRATVTFKAWYKAEGCIDAIYERSQFIFENSKWFYTQGTQKSAKLPSRNDPCVCNSGKKFKQCCLKSI